MKILVCLKLLGSGRSLDDMDGCVKMGPETIFTYIKRSWSDLHAIYGARHPNRRPGHCDLGVIEDEYSKLCFRGCVGSVDCMKLKENNFPYHVKGEYQNGRDGQLATLQVAAWVDKNLYVWHWFAGLCGTNNDKTMVARSPFFRECLTGTYDLKLQEG